MPITSLPPAELANAYMLRDFLVVLASTLPIEILVLLEGGEQMHIVCRDRLLHCHLLVFFCLEVYAKDALSERRPRTEDSLASQTECICVASHHASCGPHRITELEIGPK